jgi:hypothetical protein
MIAGVNCKGIALCKLEGVLVRGKDYSLKESLR